MPDNNMRYRTLGDTGLEVSSVGLGCAMIGSASTDYAVELIDRAMALGVNFFDVARVYRDAEIKIGLALEGRRDEAIISTKTTARDAEQAWRDINESLERLRTDHVENIHLHGLGSVEDLENRMSDDGALQALLRARDEGLTAHIGATSHHAAVLAEAIRRYPFEVILVPMNIVNRAPEEDLLPLCKEKGVGVTIMKPVGTGLFPAQIALKWLLAQKLGDAFAIDSVVPGATEIHEAVENAGVGAVEPVLSAEELAQVALVRQEYEHKRCRICRECQPCEAEVNIGSVLGTDVMYDHYRTMGPVHFREFEWSLDAVSKDLEGRQETIAKIQACTDCGACEERCPHGLPVRAMLQSVVPAMQDMVAAYNEILAR